MEARKDKPSCSTSHIGSIHYPGASSSADCASSHTVPNLIHTVRPQWLWHTKQAACTAASWRTGRSTLLSACWQQLLGPSQVGWRGAQPVSVNQHTRKIVARTQHIHTRHTNLCCCLAASVLTTATASTSNLQQASLRSSLSVVPRAVKPSGGKRDDDSDNESSAAPAAPQQQPDIAADAGVSLVWCLLV